MSLFSDLKVSPFGVEGSECSRQSCSVVNTIDVGLLVEPLKASAEYSARMKIYAGFASETKDEFVIELLRAATKAVQHRAIDMLR